MILDSPERSEDMFLVSSDQMVCSVKGVESVRPGWDHSAPAPSPPA